MIELADPRHDLPVEDTGLRVRQLWRYPVKSLAGQSLERADVGLLGLKGDRTHGLVDLDTGLVLTARRAPQLLFATPVPVPPPDPREWAIALPDGTVTDDDAVLSEWLGRRVHLRRAAPGGHGRYEIARNDDRPEGGWTEWDGPDGVFHDSTRTRVSIVSADALGDWDPRRFRANVVLAGGDERDLLGHAIRIGGAELEVVKQIDRCVIVTRPQPGIERDKDVLIQVHRRRDGCFGVGALVRAPARSPSATP